MMVKKRNILFALGLLFVIVIFSSTKLTNIFITPVGILIANIENGNFTPNKYLIERGIDIKLKKYEWTYFIKNMNDRVVVNFTADVLDDNKYKFQMADMHILDKNISDSLFIKLTQVGLDKCENIITKKEIKNGYLMNCSYCQYEGENFLYYNIPSKKVMITFYPYIENEKNKQVLQDFLDGIIIMN